jgi:hypothetical protein
MGLLASVMPPAHAAVILILPSFLTNAWQMWDGAALGRLVRRLWPLQLGVLAGTLWAPVSLVTLNANVASAGLGAALMVYAVLGLALSAVGAPPRRGVSSGATGLITGAITAATGVFVFPAVPYLQALSLKKDELVQALGLSFTVSTVALFGRLALEGSFSAGAAARRLELAAALPAALLGMAAGQMLRGRLDEKDFKRLFFMPATHRRLHARSRRDALNGNAGRGVVGPGGAPYQGGVATGSWRSSAARGLVPARRY